MTNEKAAASPSPGAKRPIALHEWIVLAMVTVAVVGAVVAYRGAKSEQDTTILMQRLAQGQLLELNMRQEALSNQSMYDLLHSRRRAFQLQGRQFMGDAAAAHARGADEEAEWLDMRAQEEFVAARAVRPFTFGRVFPVQTDFDLSPVTKDSKIALTDEQMLQLYSANALANLGFETTWHDPREPRVARAKAAGADSCSGEASVGSDREVLARQSPSIWCRLDDKIEHSHDLERDLALAVACLVLALALFTASYCTINAKRRWWKWLYFHAGIAVAGCTLIVVAYWVSDTPAAWHWLLAAVMGTPLGLVGLWLVFGHLERRKRSTPADPTDGHPHPDAFGHEKVGGIAALVLPHIPESRFTRLAVLGLALILVISAFFGWRYTVADTYARAAADEARAYAHEMSVRSGKLGFELGRFANAVAQDAEYRSRLAAVHQRITLLHRNDDERYARHLQQDGENVRSNDRFLDDVHAGVEGDPAFPRRLLLQRLSTVDQQHLQEYNPWEPFAMWDAKSGQSLAFRKSATEVLATLTLFAIALYLLGQALGMGRSRGAYSLVTASILFALVGMAIGWVAHLRMSAALADKRSELLSDDECAADKPSIVNIKDGPADSWVRAAYYYAMGEVLEGGASDHADMIEAQRYLQCAAELRPKFWQVWVDMANARSNADSSDVGEIYTSLPSIGALQDVMRAYAGALTALDRADRKPSALLLNNLAFHELLDGLIRNDDSVKGPAERSERAAMRAIAAATGADQAVSPTDLSIIYYNLGLARLALGNVAEAQVAYGRALDVSANWYEAPLRASALTDLETLKAWHCDRRGISVLEATHCTDEVNELKALVVHGPSENKPMPKAPGIAEENFSSSVTAGHLSATVRGLDRTTENVWLVWYQFDPTWNSWRAMQRLSRPVPMLAGDRTSFTEHRSYIGQYKDLQQCLPEGRYRAELYANGALVAARDDEQPLSPMNATNLMDLNLRLCMPPSWKTIPEPGATDKQGSNYGLVRAVQTAEDDPARKPSAFLFTEYLPLHPIVGGRCRRREEVVSCAVGALQREQLVRPNERLVSYDGLDAGQPMIPNDSLVYRLWTTVEGEAHLIIVQGNALPAQQLWQLLESAETIYDETGTPENPP